MLRCSNGCANAMLCGGGKRNMGLIGSDLMNLLVQKMSYLNQRQVVLAENVANAATPGYKDLDLEPFTFSDSLKSAQMTMVSTNPNDIIPASMSGGNARTVRAKGYETLPSGNSVDLEQEMMKVSENSVDYQTVTSIYHKMAGLFKIAIKGSSS